MMVSSLLLTVALAVGADEPGDGERYHWESIDGKPNAVALMEGSKQVGVFYHDTGVYKWRFGDSFGPPATCPVKLPTRNFGVARSRLGGVDKCLVGCQGEVSFQEALSRIRGNTPSLPSYANRVRVVVVGEGAAQVAADWQKHPALVALHERAIFQAYSSDDWRAAFTCTSGKGKPSIYVLFPDGEEAWHQEDYSGGAESLAPHIADAERRCDPDYRPDKSPGPGNEALSLSRFLRQYRGYIVPALLGVVAVAGYFLLRKER